MIIYSIKVIQQFRQIKIAGTFIHMNVVKCELAALIRIASSPFGQENDWCAPTGFQIRESRITNSSLITHTWIEGSALWYRFKSQCYEVSVLPFTKFSYLCYFSIFAGSALESNPYQNISLIIDYGLRKFRFCRWAIIFFPAFWMKKSLYT